MCWLSRVASSSQSDLLRILNSIIPLSSFDWLLPLNVLTVTGWMGGSAGLGWAALRQAQSRAVRLWFKEMTRSHWKYLSDLLRAYTPSRTLRCLSDTTLFKANIYICKILLKCVYETSEKVYVLNLSHSLSSLRSIIMLTFTRPFC